MHKFILFENGKSANFYIDIEADAGVRKIAETVLSDFTKVTDEKVGLQDTVHGDYCIAFTQYQKSNLLTQLEETGKIDL